MPLSTRYTSFKIDCITLFAFAFAMLAVGEMHIKSKFFLNETYFLKLELHLEIISTTSPMHSSRLPPLEVKFSFNMRHHLPASTGATFVNLSLYFLIPFSFSGAGGPITNFGHQLLLPTQFSFGPGTPGELFSLDPISLKSHCSPGLPVLEGSSVAVSGAGDPGYGLQLAQVRNSI